VNRTKLLAHDWFSGCLATAYAIEKLLLRERCPRPNTVTVLCQVTKRKGACYEPNCLKVLHASLERDLKSKAYLKSII